MVNKKQIALNIMVDSDDLVGAIVDKLQDNEIFDLIKNLDLKVSDYSFTVALRDYFVNEIKEENRVAKNKVK